ncbi:hypothetical protein ACNKHV_07670 [Shigella flexneri]
MLSKGVLSARSFDLIYG